MCFFFLCDTLIFFTHKSHSFVFSAFNKCIYIEISTKCKHNAIQNKFYKILRTSTESVCLVQFIIHLRLKRPPKPLFRVLNGLETQRGSIIVFCFHCLENEVNSMCSMCFRSSSSFCYNSMDYTDSLSFIRFLARISRCQRIYMISEFSLHTSDKISTFWNSNPKMV